MIKMIIMDVDGVLTDGSITLSESGEELKTFNIKDGMGIVLALKAGIKIAFLSARYSKALALRAKEIGVTEIHHGSSKKISVVEKIMKDNSLKAEDIAYIGDDLNDIPAMKITGFPCAVGDAIKEVKDIAKYISGEKGGRGAVREIIEYILKKDGVYEKAINAFFKEKDSKA